MELLGQLLPLHVKFDVVKSRAIQGRYFDRRSTQRSGALPFVSLRNPVENESDMESVLMRLKTISISF